MISDVETLSTKIGLRRACEAMGVTRAQVYRSRRMAVAESSSTPRRRSSRAISHEEREMILSALNSPRFRDLSPREVWAALLDEGVYICSWRTFYRVLASEGQVRERRDQLRHPTYEKPELLATGPNQVWSWDITKLRGPEKWSYFYLYVILDIYSRAVVGWKIAFQEAAHIAEALIEATYDRHRIQPGQLTLHADRGIPMASKPVAYLLADLGVRKSHSRPYVSNDNPFSEAQFKTMKYSPAYPKRFGSLADANVWAGEFIEWYNECHHHSGINYLTPNQVHAGRACEVLSVRQEVLLKAYERHPERFVRGVPSAGELPPAVWINPPVRKDQDGSSTIAP